VVCPIRLKEEWIGLVWIIEGKQELSELDMRAAEHAAIIIALQIAHQRTLASFEAQLGYTFLDSLLEGRFEATPQALERAQMLGFNPEANYCVGILVIDEVLPLSREGLLHRAALTRRLHERLKALEVAPLLSFTLNRICFLLPPRISQHDIWKALEEKGISLAFGQSHRGIEGIQHSYREVLSLLVYLPPDSCHSYETLLLPRVLLGDQEAQQAFLEQLLGHLKRQRNGDILFDTLLTWTRSGFSSSSVIEHMTIHLKTLRYRLARVEKLTTLKLSDPETRFQLQLASHLLFLREQFLP
jgi:purine catabolism regulator